jgi:hypothetical protein
MYVIEFRQRKQAQSFEEQDVRTRIVTAWNDKLFDLLTIYDVTYYIVTCIPIARQRIGEHIPAEANACNRRTSIAGQWTNKHASLTIGAVFSAWSVQSGYKEVFSIE